MMHFKEVLLINKDEPLLNAWKKIESNKQGIVFVVDNKYKLVGSLSDGDIRRAILEIDSINISCSDAMNPDCSFITLGGLDEHSDNFHTVLPIVDRSMHLIDISILEANDFSIGNKLISEDSRPIYVAEIGNNHQGDISLAFDMISAAAESGADVVKFQMRDMGTLYRNTQSAEDLGVEYTKNLLSKYNLSSNDLLKCFDKCKEHNVIPMCTPFDKQSLENLISYKIPVLKIASADFVNTELLEGVIRSRIPFVISTGMASSDEISMIFEFLKKYRANFVPLHCNSTYPTPYNDVNLNYMSNLKEISPLGIVGYSGHERGYEVCLGAIGMGARIIEKHFTFDKKLEGVDHKVSLLPSEFNELVTKGNNLFDSLGSKSIFRKVSQGEMINRENLGKSIVYKTDLNVDSVIQRNDLVIQSPGRGLPPYMLPKIINKKLIKSVHANDFCYLSDFSKDDSLVAKYSFKRPFGIPVRFHDCTEMTKDMPYNLIEFHLTYDDLHKSVEPPSKSFKKVVVHSPELFADDHILDLASSDSSFRDISIHNLKKTIQKAEEISNLYDLNEPIQLVTNVGGWSTDGFISNDEKIKSKYSLTLEALNSLKSERVEVIIQTMPPYPWHFGGQSFHNLFVSPEEIINFCEMSGYFICLDLSHTYMACEFYNLSFEKQLKTLLPFSKHLHISDAVGMDGEGLQISQGDINFEQVIPILNKYGEDISFIPEIWQGHKENGLAFKTAINALHDSGLK